MLGELLSGVVKAALTPIAVAKDVVDVVKGKEATNTKKHVKSIGKDLKEVEDRFFDGV